MRYPKIGTATARMKATVIIATIKAIQVAHPKIVWLETWRLCLKSLMKTSSEGAVSE